MQKVSFVIYFHSSRLKNLNQVLRFLELREPFLKDSEVILICQDQCDGVVSNFGNVNQINLNYDFYHKSYFCNYGVNVASGEVIVLLDSDRILPKNYFTNCAVNLPERTFVSTSNLYNLIKDYTDEEILLNKISKVEDFRCKLNSGRRKNLFSGNTVFYKKDFQLLGGMDESMLGYGFVDNDMTQKVVANGYNIAYLPKDELHLYHTKDVHYHGNVLVVPKFRIMTAINCLKYFKKWNLPFDRESSILIHDVKRNLNSYDKKLVEEFLNLIRE